MAEEWRDVVGYEGWYQISQVGQVKRVRSSSSTFAGRILKSCANGKYLVVSLSKNGRIKTRYIHALVLEAFCGPRPFSYECNHKNGDTLDNRLENLEWVTHGENQKHAYRVLGTKLRGVCEGLTRQFKVGIL